MDLIYTDKNLKDIGVLKDYSLDFDMNVDKDFEIVVAIDNPCTKVAQKGSFIYMEGTEYGGQVDSVTINTMENKATIHGINYRAMLNRKIIEPPVNEDYRVVSGNISEIGNSLINELQLSDLFEFAESDLNINTYQFDRYIPLFDGIEKLLKKEGYVVELFYDNEKRKIIITVREIVDYSELIEFSEDDNINFMITQHFWRVNHLICLGKGELKDRTVIHLYADEEGNISFTQTLFGLDEVSEVYDYSSVESDEELLEKGIEKFMELMNKDTFEITVDNIDLKIGDIVGGTERTTGIKCKDEITNIIVKIENDILTSDYKIGGK